MVKVPFRTQKIHQTDYRMKRQAKKDFGCFFVTIRMNCEDVADKAMTAKETNVAWARAVHEGAMKRNGFVKNHEHVGNICLDILGLYSKGYRFRYVKKVDADGEETLYRKSDAGKQNATGIVWNTPDGIHMNQGNSRGDEAVEDPYPGLELISLDSIRWYYIGRD